MLKNKYVFIFDGPVGAGKTSLGQETATRLSFGFIDGDDYSMPGPWLRSILKTSKRILAASIEKLESYPGVIIAYPVRHTNWFFYNKSCEKMGVICRCVGLTANIENISHRDRKLSQDEEARCVEMIKQGYGKRDFSDIIIQTDKVDFEETCQHLVESINDILYKFESVD